MVRARSGPLWPLGSYVFSCFQIELLVVLALLGLITSLVVSAPVAGDWPPPVSVLLLVVAPALVALGIVRVTKGALSWRSRVLLLRRFDGGSARDIGFLARVLGSYGTVTTAIDRNVDESPHSSLTHLVQGLLGDRRAWVHLLDDRWREQVEDCVSRSSVVIFDGRRITPHLEEEMRIVARHLPPECVVMIRCASAHETPWVPLAWAGAPVSEIVVPDASLSRGLVSRRRLRWGLYRAMRRARNVESHP